MKRWAVLGTLLLLLGLASVPVLPHGGPVDLELYDVQDLTYGGVDFPGVEISLAVRPAWFEASCWLGEDLASWVRPVTGPDAEVHFQNGLLIIRAGRVGQARVRGLLALLRGWQRAVDGLQGLRKETGSFRSPT